MADLEHIAATADAVQAAIDDVWPLICPLCPNKGDVAAAVVGAYMDEDGWPSHLRGQVPPWMERVGHMAPVAGIEQPTACPADCGGDTIYRVKLKNEGGQHEDN